MQCVEDEYLGESCQQNDPSDWYAHRPAENIGDGQPGQSLPEKQHGAHSAPEDDRGDGCGDVRQGQYAGDVLEPDGHRDDWPEDPRE